MLAFKISNFMHLHRFVEERYFLLMNLIEKLLPWSSRQSKELRFLANFFSNLSGLTGEEFQVLLPLQRASGLLTFSPFNSVMARES